MTLYASYARQNLSLQLTSLLAALPWFLPGNLSYAATSSVLTSVPCYAPIPPSSYIDVVLGVEWIDDPSLLIKFLHGLRKARNSLLLRLP